MTMCCAHEMSLCGGPAVALTQLTQPAQCDFHTPVICHDYISIVHAPTSDMGKQAQRLLDMDKWWEQCVNHV